MGTRTQIVEAHQQGTEAGRRGDPPNGCPYGRDSILQAAWIKGYVAGLRQVERSGPHADERAAP
ncbi:Rmf/CrpP fold protein [Streptomyces sp. HUAS TT3]|uniref:Rmf/CrpP fold protein n=1 Tax=Streptomyces sp. HUAS TT3 TaxID=3447510 RepID=UPI003F65788E